MSNQGVALLQFFLFPCSLFASMLSDAESVGKSYAVEVAKKPPPSALPNPAIPLNSASVWFSLDLNELLAPDGQNALAPLQQNAFWQMAKDLKIEAIHLKGLKGAEEARVSLAIDPQFSQDWPLLMQTANQYKITWVGDLIGPATGVGPDFQLALQNVDDYPSLYHLLPIQPDDWTLLPQAQDNAIGINVPWLDLEALTKKGYVPEARYPYIKQSAWNTTGKIVGKDGKIHRWIYLKAEQNDPVLAWLSPSFATGKLLTGDALSSLYRYGQNILYIDAHLPFLARETTSLWIRKIGGFSAQKNSQDLKNIKTAPSDLVLDTLTPPALLHALITEDAEALRLMYRLYQQADIASCRLIHALEPFDPYACEWTEFLQNPKKNYLYGDEMITGALLNRRLLKEDLARLQKENRSQLPISTWGGYCALAFGVASDADFQKQAKTLQKAHLLLATTYAMQPGVFSFSLSDLLGTLPQSPKQLDLWGSNPGCLYPSLPCQLQSLDSFTASLRQILNIRKQLRIAQGKLIAVLPSPNQGTLLLLHQLPDSKLLQLLAVNFSRQTALEQFELPAIEGTWAIEMLSSQNVPKGFESGKFSFSLNPISAKVFLFQNQAYKQQKI